MTEALTYSSNYVLGLVPAPLIYGPSRLIGHTPVDPKQRKPYLVVTRLVPFCFPLSSTQLTLPSITTKLRILHTQNTICLISNLHTKPKANLRSSPHLTFSLPQPTETKDDQTISPSEQYPEQTKNDPEKATPGTSPKLKRAARVIEGISHPPPPSNQDPISIHPSQPPLETPFYNVEPQRQQPSQRARQAPPWLFHNSNLQQHLRSIQQHVGWPDSSLPGPDHDRCSTRPTSTHVNFHARLIRHLSNPVDPLHLRWPPRQRIDCRLRFLR